MPDRLTDTVTELERLWLERLWLERPWEVQSVMRTAPPSLVTRHLP